jgi:hypothetical protein
VIDYYVKAARELSGDASPLPLVLLVALSTADATALHDRIAFRPRGRYYLKNRGNKNICICKNIFTFPCDSSPFQSLGRIAAVIVVSKRMGRRLFPMKIVLQP